MENFYNGKDELTGKILLEADGDQYCRYQLGRWHSLEVLEEDVMKLDISRRTGGATACSSNRWNSESRGKACFDYAESRQRKRREAA